ncbi:Hypothetical protein HVR_LOCUS1250 [uncultured virus]|nr:Hypothetical protein HVR_LOCUS1250 [uncultured virus]
MSEVHYSGPHTRRNIKITFPEEWKMSSMLIHAFETDEDLRHVLKNLGGFGLEAHGRIIIRCNDLSSDTTYKLVPPTKQSKHTLQN